jgi:integrase
VSDSRRTKLKAPKPRYLKARRFRNKDGVERHAFYWILPPHLADAHGFARQVRLVSDMDTDGDPNLLYHRACLEAEELNAEYDRRRKNAAAVRRDPADIPDTLPYFMRQFRKTVQYEQLSEKTKVDTYEYGWRILTRWSALLDDIPVQRISRPICVELYEHLSEADPDTGRRQLARARTVIRSLSRLLSYAQRKGAIETNPCFKLEMATLKLRLETWSEEEIQKFCDAALKRGKGSLAVAVRMAADTGQRRGDIIGVRWRDLSDGYFHFVQSKSGARVRVLATQRLLDMMAYAPTAGCEDQVIVLNESTGRPYTASAFSREIREIAESAGVFNRWFHDLRRTAVVNLARAGATVPEIVAVTGHSLDHAGKVLKHYLYPDSEQAEAAILKLINHQGLARLERGGERIVKSDAVDLTNIIMFPDDQASA